MANQLQMAGSPGKPLKFVPIYTSRFFQGLWTHRSPLRAGALGWQTEKYFGSHNDSLIDGLNTEISTRLTLTRRPGTSVYNNNDFPAILSFYSFRLFSTTSETIKVIADTAHAIYDATGPSTDQIIYTKTAAGGPARFQSVGNTLYFGDGDVDKKWIQSLNAWTPNTTFNINDYFIDSNGNIQVFGDLAVFRTTTFFPIASTSLSGSVLKVRYYTGGRGGNTQAVPGSVVSMSDMTIHTELNGQGVSGTVVSDLPVTATTQTFSELGSQSVADNILTVTVQFSGWPTSTPQFLFPVGAVVSFTGVQDSVLGGGGVILTSSINNLTTTATFTVTYIHPDYGVVSNSLHNIKVYYGDREITLNTSLALPGWSDTKDTGFVCVGSTGSQLTNIGDVTITDNVIHIVSSSTFGATIMPYTKITFASFTGATAFLNGTEAVVLSCNTFDLTAVYYHTDLPTTASTGGGRVINTVSTPLPSITVTDVTITAGIAFFTGTNDFHVGDVLTFSGFATATELNGTQAICSFSNGSFFHTHVPFADRGLTVDAGTVQEQYGYLVLKDGTMTLTQPNSYSVGQSVVFSGLSIASLLNGHSFVLKNVDANQYSGVYPDGTAVITQVAVNSNVATITANNQFSAGQFVTLQTNIPNDPSPPNNPFPTFAKVISATSTSFTIAAVYSNFSTTPVVGNAFLFYTIMTDVGGKTSTVPGSAGTGTTGSTSPNFNTLSGASIFEGNMEWVNHGSNLQNMGIVGPVLAPDVTLIPSTTLPPTDVWKARAYFGQSGAGPITIVDNSVGPGPYIQEVIQAGTTGGSQPVWNTALNGTTADGTVVWKNKGTLGRLQNTAYQLGARIVVTYYTQVITGYTGPAGPPGSFTGSGGFTGTSGFPIYKTVGPFSSYFTCTKAGTTADLPASSITWSNSPGQFVTDGTVTWQNTGAVTLWPGANTDLSTSGVSSIVDSNGNIENVLVAGVTGLNPPSWSIVQGGTTADGTVRWVNAGPSATGVTSTTPGKTYYGYAFKNSFTNEVSNMSPISEPVILETGGAVSVSGRGPTDAQADTIVIYRTLQGGSTFFWLAEISVKSIVGGFWNYLDVSPDPPSPNSTMNLLIQAAVNLENTPPPHGATNWAFHLNRLWYSVGNLVGFSNPPGFSTGSSYTQFPPGSFFTFPSKVTRLWPLGTPGILVFTVSDIYIITGTTTLTFAAFPFLKGVGLLNYNSLSIMGSIIMMHTTDNQLLSLDPNSGVTEVGFPIGDQINARLSPATSYVSWHASGSEDKALYFSDGATGWFRLAPAAAPEAGLIWSPFAEIVGGISAVQSVEVSPGVFRLLIGSPPH